MQYEVILGVIVGGLIAFYYLKTRQNTPKHLKQRAADLDELLKMKTKESNKWKGRFNSRNAGPVVVSDNSDSGDELNLEKVIPELAQNYLPHAPTWLKPLLQDPGVVKYGIQLAKENPEKAKELLGKFVGKKLSGGTVQEEVSGL